MVLIHDTVRFPELLFSETELNTHNVTPAVVRTIPKTAPEGGGGVFKFPNNNK